jgi:predicted enzyme related to lactoylglutathione lyase
MSRISNIKLVVSNLANSIKFYRYIMQFNITYIVDSDATSLSMIKFALAEIGKGFNQNSYNPDVWANILDYKGRSIET